MEHLFGGYNANPKQLIENAINFFENLYALSLEFDGIIDKHFFMGIIKEKSNRKNINSFFLDNNEIFKSLYYHEVPEKLKKTDNSFAEPKTIINLQNDFIYVLYEKEKNIKVYIDKFAKEKIYYTVYAPYLFSTSFKLLIFLIKQHIINYDVLTRFLITGAIIGNETIFRNINRLDIGESLNLNKFGINISKYWSINKDFFNIYNHNAYDFPFWTEKIYEFLKETVDLPIKKPILSLMSGGLDSTVITSILKKEYGLPIEALTIIVPNYNEEEGIKAKEIADYLNIPHRIEKVILKNRNELNDFYSKIFNISEEPMGGTAFFSRFFAFDIIKRLNKQNILTGDGAGEIFSYVRDYLLKRLNYVNYKYYIPTFIRYFLMRTLQKLYYPTLNLTGRINNKNLRNGFEILMNSNFLLANSQFQSFFASWQFSNLEESFRITGQRINLTSYFRPILTNLQSYPFRDYNRLGFQFMINSINSDALITHNLASFYNLKLYCPYLSDTAFKKILPIPPYLKMTGDRGKWIVREIAKKKKLLPEEYFEWKPKYGLRQLFFEEDSFNFVRTYIFDLIDSLKSNRVINLNPFKKFYKKTSLKQISIHSTEYMKFNIWFGFLGWLSSIHL